MLVIKFYLFIYLFFILLSSKLYTVNSIQCCVGSDNTCSMAPVDCPSNVCFKLVINKASEERGCMNDLIALVNVPNIGPNPLNDDSGSSNDQCQQSDTQGTGMSLYFIKIYILIENHFYDTPLTLLKDISGWLQPNVATKNIICIMA
ncbi:unnamed protein product [Adineta steineri]|uniref:Uncharacterized protein n=1 Tax=Adineta steineri TaxID=433720 RepID=A0A819MCZ2_9BILA|nr:unnamed protein product [Adineta steineri]CAF3977330.1 unnamed protein product [Adineta steineri]